MGEVFLAEQEGPQGFRRKVVIKRLLRHLASDGTFVEMFLAEARVASLIAHPNVVQIIELGEADGSLFLAMEHVRGQSLRELLKTVSAAREEIPASVCVAIIVGVLRGLHAAHTLVDEDGSPRGCVHRDVSAENVLLSVDGGVKLVDFGIAKSLAASTVKTALRGKWGYLAPEQYRRDRLDARCDVFACAVLLFELLTGARPFVAESEATIMNATLHQPAPALPSSIEGAHRLDEILKRALAKDPSARWETAAAMADELEAFLEATDRNSLADYARTWIRTEAEPSPAGTENLGAVSPGTVALGSPADEATLKDAQPRGAAVHARRRAIAVGTVAVALGGAVIGGLPWLVRHRAPPATTTQKASAPASEASSTSALATATAATDSAGLDALGVPSAPSGAPAPEAAEVATRRGPEPGAKRFAATPSLSAGVGSLAFRVRPWAEIFVDGRSVGVSPVPPVTLPAGRHHVLLRNRDLSKERAVTTTVARGETTTLKVDLLE
jgi:serine/threonine-protein kinase